MKYNIENNKNIDLPLERLYFFDNLRSTAILFVVIFHSAIAYMQSASFWPVLDSGNTGKIANTILSLLTSYLDAVLMPVLFFIAGYFAIGSIVKTSPLKFVLIKIKRFGIPLILMTAFYIPITKYIYLFNRTIDKQISYREIWLKYMHTVSDAYIGPDFQNYFNPSYLWFLSLLIIFYLIFAVTYPFLEKIISPSFTKNNKTKILLPFLFFILFNTLTLLLLLNYFKVGQWILFGPLIMFQPVRVISYMTLFFMGIYAFKQEWFIENKIPGKLYAWLVLMILCMAGSIIIGPKIYMVKNPSFIITILFSIIRPIYFLSIVFFYSILFHKFFNKISTIGSSLNENSYYIYIIHYAIVIILQMLLFIFFDFPSFLKFIISAVFSIILSFAISKFIINPFPKISIVVLLLLFGCLFILL